MNVERNEEIKLKRVNLNRLMTTLLAQVVRQRRFRLCEYTHRAWISSSTTHYFETTLIDLNLFHRLAVSMCSEISESFRSWLIFCAFDDAAISNLDIWMLFKTCIEQNDKSTCQMLWRNLLWRHDQQIRWLSMLHKIMYHDRTCIHFEEDN